MFNFLFDLNWTNSCFVTFASKKSLPEILFCHFPSSIFVILVIDTNYCNVKRLSALWLLSAWYCQGLSSRKYHFFIVTAGDHSSLTCHLHVFLIAETTRLAWKRFRNANFSITFFLAFQLTFKQMGKYFFLPIPW